MKKISPYTRLLIVFNNWANSVLNREYIPMWKYLVTDMRSGKWEIEHLYHRTAAAQQLGYVVYLHAKDDGLVVGYLKKLPGKPQVLDIMENS
ncbi:MAG: hypothetical protein P3A28_09025 [Gemmatimonadota bacterium]|nr:hypothetical protein [Gemmatimonadota bacterium]